MKPQTVQTHGKAKQPQILLIGSWNKVANTTVPHQRSVQVGGQGCWQAGLVFLTNLFHRSDRLTSPHLISGSAFALTLKMPTLSNVRATTATPPFQLRFIEAVGSSPVLGAGEGSGILAMTDVPWPGDDWMMRSPPQALTRNRIP